MKNENRCYLKPLVKIVPIWLLGFNRFFEFLMTRKSVLKNRSDRLALWQAAAGESGLISVGNAAWLLDISRQRVCVLVALDVLESRNFGGQRLLVFSSVARYAENNAISVNCV